MIGTSRVTSLLTLSRQCSVWVCPRMFGSSSILSLCSHAIRTLICPLIALAITSIIIYACLFVWHRSITSLSILSASSSCPTYSLQHPQSCTCTSPTPSSTYYAHTPSSSTHPPSAPTHPSVSSSRNWTTSTMYSRYEFLIIAFYLHCVSFSIIIVPILSHACTLTTCACINLLCAITLVTSPTILLPHVFVRHASSLLSSVIIQESLFITSLYCRFWYVRDVFCCIIKFPCWVTLLLHQCLRIFSTFTQFIMPVVCISSSRLLSASLWTLVSGFACGIIVDATSPLSTLSPNYQHSSSTLPFHSIPSYSALLTAYSLIADSIMMTTIIYSELLINYIVLSLISAQLIKRTL